MQVLLWLPAHFVIVMSSRKSLMLKEIVKARKEDLVDFWIVGQVMR